MSPQAAAIDAFNQTRAACLKAMRESIQARDTALLNDFTLEAKLHNVSVALQWIALGMDAHSYNVLGILASIYNLHHGHLDRAVNDAQFFVNASELRPEATPATVEKSDG